MTLGDVLKEARLAKGLSQAQVAKKLGYSSPQFIFLMESGKSKLPFNKISAICRILDLDKNDVVGFFLSEFKRELFKAARI